jgi:hypothetical protein
MKGRVTNKMTTVLDIILDRPSFEEDMHRGHILSAVRQISSSCRKTRVKERSKGARRRGWKENIERPGALSSSVVLLAIPEKSSAEECIQRLRLCADRTAHVSFESKFHSTRNLILFISLLPSLSLSLYPLSLSLSVLRPPFLMYREWQAAHPQHASASGAHPSSSAAQLLLVPGLERLHISTPPSSVCSQHASQANASHNDTSQRQNEQQHSGNVQHNMETLHLASTPQPQQPQQQQPQQQQQLQEQEQGLASLSDLGQALEANAVARSCRTQAMQEK